MPFPATALSSVSGKRRYGNGGSELNILRYVSTPTSNRPAPNDHTLPRGGRQGTLLRIWPKP
eukprot:1656784-Alexandrium_andersonii.AAC.1